MQHLTKDQALMHESVQSVLTAQSVRRIAHMAGACQNADGLLTLYSHVAAQSSLS